MTSPDAKGAGIASARTDPREHPDAPVPDRMELITWDTVAGIITTQTLGSRMWTRLPENAVRTEQELLAHANPAVAESVVRRARAAQASGDLLDARVALSPPRGPPQVLWIHCRREDRASPGAPLVGALIDITNLPFRLDLLGATQPDDGVESTERPPLTIGRAFATLSRGGRILNTATDEQSLLEDICATIVTEGGYHFAWYGRVEHDAARTVRPVAHAGHEVGYLEEMRFSWSPDDPAGRGPTGEAIRTGQVSRARDISSHPGTEPWRAAADARGYVSSIALPVMLDGSVHGALIVYATEPDAFDVVEAGLLGDLALDIGHGLRRLADTRALLLAALTAAADGQRLRATLDSLLDPFVLLDAVRDASGTISDLRYVDANEAAAAYNGITRDRLLGHTLLELLPGHLGSDPLAAYVHTIETGEPMILDDLPYFNELLGELRRTDSRAVRNGDGIALTWRDVTERSNSVQLIADSERRYRLLAENASDVVLQVGSDGRISWVSESVTALLGWSGRDILGRVATELVHPDDHDSAVRGLITTGRTAPANGRIRVMRSDGSALWMTAASHHVESGTDTFRVVTLRDIGDVVAAQVELEHAMQHDPLTGFSTRALTQQSLSRMLEHTTPGERCVAVLCVGIDSLAPVNEALGHDAGDRVISSVAIRLSSFARAVDHLGRAGGDEFHVLLPDLTNGADALLLAEQLRLAAQGPLDFGAHHLAPTVSIGIATGDRSSSAEDLLRDAGLAMRSAKAEGRDRCAFADASLAVEAQRRLLVAGAIRDALRDGELVPWFQPVVSLADGSLTGYEALVRWVRPDGTTVEPAAFLSVAERSSLIVEVDLAVLDRSVSALATLPAPLTIAVNVSAATLKREGFEEHVVERLAQAGIDPSRLHLEVTETALLLVTDRVREVMERLAEHGVRWWMDDFGTGYSSIAHLRDLPISGMKLDRSFTSAMGSGDITSDRLAQALGGLANGLGLATIAEGVETTTEAERLAAHGWVLGQGWLYGRAAPLP